MSSPFIDLDFVLRLYNTEEEKATHLQYFLTSLKDGTVYKSNWLTYNNHFDLNYYNKTYNYDFKRYEVAYFDWKEKKNCGYKGWKKIVDNIEYESQLDQDYYVINDLFKQCTGGVFIEFGACDGKFLSNTYTMEKYYGWSGLCIEPIDKYFNDLKKNRSCITNNSVLYSENNKEIQFDIKDNNETSGISIDMYNQKNKTVDMIKRKTIKLETLLDKLNFSKVIHYMSVDVEGAEYEILKVFPFDKYKVYCLSIEHGYNEENKNKIRELMKKNGYILQKEMLWDDIFVLPELLEKQVVNSFDFFDTLAYRYYINPDEHIKQLETKYNIPDFFTKRKTEEINTDGTLIATYQSMYKKQYLGENEEEMKKIMNEEMRKIMNEEINTDLNHLIINGKLKRLLKQKDIIISDTYYNEQFIKTFLEKHGLYNNTIYTSPAGKKNGSIWKKLKDKYLIVTHYGDNIKSDIINAINNGINANHIKNNFIHSKPIQMLNSIKLESLSKVMLAGLHMYIPNKNINQLSYINTGPISFFLNVIMAEILLRVSRDKKYDNILLTMRDCCLLKKIIDVMYVELKDKTKLFYTSRKCYRTGSCDFKKYFYELLSSNTNNVIVDVNGSGKSLCDFLNKANFNKPIELMLYNKTRNTSFEKCEDNKFKITFLDSISRTYDILEILNVDIDGTTHDIINNVPIKSPLEYPVEIPQATHLYFYNTLDWLNDKQHIITNIRLELETLSTDELVQILRGTCSALLTDNIFCSNILQYHQKDH